MFQYQIKLLLVITALVAVGLAFRGFTVPLLVTIFFLIHLFFLFGLPCIIFSSIVVSPSDGKTIDIKSSPVIYCFLRVWIISAFLVLGSWLMFLLWLLLI